MTDLIHGITVTEINNGTRPIRTIPTAIIGLVGTSSDADATYYPVGESVLVTNLDKAIEKAGTQGTLAAALDGIKDQTNAICVVVRVAEDGVQANQDTLVIGKTHNGKRTGMQALLSAKTKHGVTPRILGAPGLDNQAVTTELVSVAQKLNGFAYAACAGKTISAAQAYRNNFGARELMLIDNKFTGLNNITATQGELTATARALGLRAKIDQEMGWNKSLSNVEVNGVTGTVYDRSFDLMHADTDVNLLNSKEITSIVRDKGFRFWGNRTCSNDPLYAFEVATRTAQVLKDTIGYAHQWAMAKKLSPGLASDIIEGIDSKLKHMTAEGYLLGGSAWFNDQLNTKETLKDGHLYVDYDYMFVPPLEHLHLRQSISDTYLIDFGARVNAA